MSNTFGRIFRLTTFGESHGRAVGAVVDGCPAGLLLAEKDIQRQLDRRRPGQSDLTTSRNEADTVKILSGVDDGKTLGSPIAMVVENQDQRPSDYADTQSAPRPSHADFTYKSKYGVLARSGGGRASARETLARVAGGALAEKLLVEKYGIEIVAWVSAIGEIQMPEPDVSIITRLAVDRSPVRCPHEETSENMEKLIREAASEGDSVGGVVTCACRNMPVGLGEPVFGKVGAVLAGAMMSIPAAKGFEIGSGFAGTRMRGSEHNDMFVKKGKGIGTVTNRSGGIQGGITNGETIIMRVAFKPAATIKVPQDTCGYDGEKMTMELKKGRHDPCVLPRAVPVVEAMTSLVLADLAMLAENSHV